MRHGDMSTSPPNGPYERDAAAVKNLHELSKIGKRSRQPVHLIHDDHVDLACLDISHQPFQGWSLHRAAGKPAIIIQRRQHRPAFLLLRQNEGGAGLTLSIERVECLLQACLTDIGLGAVVGAKIVGN
jgi:hypothetical protein